MSLYDAPVKTLEGDPASLKDHEGEALLIVNVASKCGLTPQYTALQALQKKYSERGFVVIGTPCNQFLGQEPGSAGEIASFCSTTYGVDFPLLAKADVNGSDRNALYRFLVDSPAGGGARISWNFEKFLVGRDGGVLRRFSPNLEPDAPEVLAAIEAALG